MIEIERKFLVRSRAFKAEAFAKHEIAQGYLNSNPERTVRVRIKDDKGFLTIKGIGNESGMSRFEWEKEIDKITKLNPYNTKDRILIKKFSSGMNVELDNNGRMLIPVDMKKNKKISKEIVLVSTINIIEIWDKDTYEEVINSTNIDIVALAEERLGQITIEENK